ncbi:15560_t:CDS:2 [Funneliformis geosporum]|uniref:15560_t:CDS:1 n=1 Tax=Funneliformis geosporum TaxID=1117311 RepID=A0A9W4SJ59_9GLOM|nr:15560_t:CDS:2 [Funneliformis geosporum]
MFFPASINKFTKKKSSKTDKFIETASNYTGYGEAVVKVTSSINTATSVLIPFEKFLPLFGDVVKILDNAVQMYVIAQHNKNICKLLIQRIGVANSQISILKTQKDLFTTESYESLQKLVNLLGLMRNFIGDISKYGKIRKYLEGKTIQQTYQELCKEYDSSINFLNLLVTINFRISAKEENEMIRKDIAALEKFGSLLESSIDASKKQTHRLKSVVKEVIELSQLSQLKQLNQVIQEVRDVKSMIDNLPKNNKSKNQKLIDNYFQEKLLKYEEYKQDESYNVKNNLRKYKHLINGQEYAFKKVASEKHSEELDQIKNQLIILKQIKGCLNIIYFYGLSFDGNYYYLVTEWASKANLRKYLECKIGIELKIRIAFDVVKGLNFLNAVGIVHHDVRPDNIVITEHDQAKITNFEYSRGNKDQTKNQELNIMRSRYNAPEILARSREEDVKQKYDVKCEVYSFGLLLWEIAEEKLPYKDKNDVLSIYNLVCLERYQEQFSPDSKFPIKYRNLSKMAVDQNPERRPVFADILIKLNDIYVEFENQSSNAVEEEPPSIPSAVFDWSLFDYMTLDEAIKEHEKAENGDVDVERDKIYKCFETFACMNDYQAKYYQAFYITKGWSDLKCEKFERDKKALELFREVADYSDEFPEAQLRYGTMLTQGLGCKRDSQQGTQYLLKAANNGNKTAMFNIATWYYMNKDKPSGDRYMTMSALKDYPPAIKYCKKNNIL